MENIPEPGVDHGLRQWLYIEVVKVKSLPGS